MSGTCFDKSESRRAKLMTENLDGTIDIGPRKLFTVIDYETTSVKYADLQQTFLD